MSQQHSFDQQDENDLGAENSVTPQPGPSSVSYFAAAGSSSPPYISPYPPSTETQAGAFTISVIRSQHTPPRPPTTLNPELRDLSFTDYPVRASMSTYSSSSASSSLYNSPNPQRYTGTIKMMSSPKQISTVCVIFPSPRDPSTKLAGLHAERETAVDPLIANSSR